MIKYQYATYRTDVHNVFGGREFVGFAGWHTCPADALAEARRRNAAGDYNPNTASRAKWGFAPIAYTPAPSDVLVVERV